MVKIIREANNVPTDAVAKKHDVNKADLYMWYMRFDAMDAVEAKRLRGPK